MVPTGEPKVFLDFDWGWSEPNVWCVLVIYSLGES